MNLTLRETALKAGLFSSDGGSVRPSRTRAEDRKSGDSFQLLFLSAILQPMTRLAIQNWPLLLIVPLLSLPGCGADDGSLDSREITRLQLPAVNRAQRTSEELEQLEAPDFSQLERDPFLTEEENEERRRRKNRGTEAEPPPRRVTRSTPTPKPKPAVEIAPVEQELEVIRRELNEQVPLIIVGKGPNPRNVAILNNGTVLEEGNIIQGYYTVDHIESDGIRIGSTDGKYKTHLPFARSSPDSSLGEWDFGSGR